MNAGERSDARSGVALTEPLNKTLNDVVTCFSRLFRWCTGGIDARSLVPEIDDSICRLDFKSDVGTPYSTETDKAQLEATLESLRSKYLSIDECRLWMREVVEVPIWLHWSPSFDDQFSSVMTNIQRSLWKWESVQERRTISIGNPSQEFLLCMLLNDHLSKYRIIEIDEIAEKIDWLWLFSSGFCDYTVKIRTEDSRTLSCGAVDRIINYLLFELNAQFSVPVLERTSRAKSNLNPVGEFVFLPSPESFSIDLASNFNVAEEPLEYFQIALLAEDPAYRFLCFYHVAEFFFEEVQEEKLKNQVRRILGEHKDTVDDQKIKALVDMMKKAKTDGVQPLEEVLVRYAVSLGRAVCGEFYPRTGADSYDFADFW